MRLFHWIAASAVLASSFLLNGCSGSSEPTESQAESDLAAAQAAVKDSRGPKEILREYLRLTQLGDQSVASKLLTTKAQEVVNKVDLKLTAPAGKDVHAKIGEMITVGEDRTKVAARWVNGNGDQLSCDLTYKLRNVSQGWRIAGMIGPFFPGGCLDFEDEKQMRNFMKYLNQGQAPGQVRPSEQDHVAKQNNGQNNSKPTLRTAVKPKPGNRIKQ